MQKITWENLKIIAEDINKRVKDNFVNGLTVINSTDFMISFSFHKEEKLLISLNHESPFVTLFPYKGNIPTTMGKDNDFLRKYVKDAQIIEAEAINDDRVLLIKIKKNDEFYQRMSLNIFIELYPHRSNLIVTDEDMTILYANHYTSLSLGRVIMKDMKYVSLPNIEKRNNDVVFDLDVFKKEANAYIDSALIKKEKEKYNSLYKFLKTKIKSLTKKEIVLKSEIQKAQDYKKDIEIGNALSAFYYDMDSLNDYIKEENIEYDSTISLSLNIEKYFKRSKKKKRTIEMTTIELEKCQNEINNFTSLINVWPYLKEDELNELSLTYLKKNINNKKNKNKEAKAIMPSYIEYKGTKIAFGKNSKQNEYLTFKLADNRYTFLHLANYSSNHVVIFSYNATNEEKQIACELCLLLGNKESGDIQSAKIKDTKKGHFTGQVLLNKYETFTVRNVSKLVKELIKNSKRF